MTLLEILEQAWENQAKVDSNKVVLPPSDDDEPYFIYVNSILVGVTVDEVMAKSILSGVMGQKLHEDDFDTGEIVHSGLMVVSIHCMRIKER